MTGVPSTGCLYYNNVITMLYRVTGGGCRRCQICQERVVQARWEDHKNNCYTRYSYTSLASNNYPVGMEWTWQR